MNMNRVMNWSFIGPDKTLTQNSLSRDKLGSATSG